MQYVIYLVPPENLLNILFMKQGHSFTTDHVSETSVYSLELFKQNNNRDKACFSNCKNLQI